MKRTLSALIACLALVGCNSKDEPIVDPAPPSSEAPSSSAAAAGSEQIAPPDKTKSKSSEDEINQVASDKAAPATADDQVFVEETIGQYISVLPPGTQVKGDPKGLDKFIAVDLPADLQGEELKQAMNQLQPIAIQAFQEHQIDTQVGRRDDGLLFVITPWSYEMKEGIVYDQYEMAKTNRPVIKDHFDYARITDLTFVLNDFEYYDNAGCVKALRNISNNFEDKDLNLAGQELFIKIPDCGGVNVIVHGYAGYMDPKINKIADIIEAQGTIPEGTQLRATYDGRLEVVMAAPVDFTVKDRVKPFWNLGEVDVRQY